MYIIYQIVYAVLFLFYLIMLVFKKRPRQGISMRLGIYPDEIRKRMVSGKNIWIHAVSVGEVMAAKVLIDKIRKEFNGYSIVVSTVTETGNSVAKKIMNNDAAIIYLPMDLTFAIERAIGIIKPAVFIIMETEIWPNLLRRLHKKNIPVILSNGRISPKALWKYLLVKSVLKNILNYITVFHMRTDEDANKIISMGADAGKVKITGNLKFDSSDFSVSFEEQQKITHVLGADNKKLFIAGSTHPKEEDIILKAYKSILNMHKDISLLIAPRHINRVDEIEKLVKSYGFSPVRISQITINYKPSAINSPIYILDTMGQLKLFYNAAWLVFMGGSLIKHGGQNMIEPAYFSKPIIFGPYTFNFKDIASLFLDNNAAMLVKNENEITCAVKALYEDNSLAQEMGKRARMIVDANRGAADKTIAAIKAILEK